MACATRAAVAVAHAERVKPRLVPPGAPRSPASTRWSPAYSFGIQSEEQRGLSVLADWRRRHDSPLDSPRPSIRIDEPIRLRECSGEEGCGEDRRGPVPKATK